MNEYFLLGSILIHEFLFSDAFLLIYPIDVLF